MAKKTVVPDAVTLLNKELNKAIQRLKKEEAKIPKLKEALKQADAASMKADKELDKIRSIAYKLEEAASTADYKLQDSEVAIEDLKQSIVDYKAQIKEAGKK